MLPNVLTKTLSDDRRVLAGWTVGATLAAIAYASFYPQISGGQMAEAVAGYPEALREAFRLDDLTSAAGYLGSSVFGLILPLIAMFYGAATGARAIAGDEESGRLDLILAHPVSRTRLVLHRFGALSAGALVIAFAIFLGMLAIRGSAKLTDVTVTEFAAQCLNLALLGIVFGALAIGIGAATGRRGLVFTITAGTGVIAYALHTFAGQLGADSGRLLSPFHYYIGGEPLDNGMQWADASVLLGVALALVAVGTVWFNRRDLNT
ncbi:ABC transporter permease subunit [Micromonospora sp. URMC 107]|uniref:ABC transporter permease subunit n=1 Tax=Micromonospora sp. URMC 107 TaxID=3423418 RepID=UPI003F1985EC